MSKTEPNVRPSAAQKKWIQILHVAKRECQLDDEAYRAVLSGACGMESASDIKTWKEYNAVLTAFKNLGFHVQSKTSKKSGLKNPDTEIKRNPGWITARQEYYIRGLWDLASRKKDEPSVRAIIKRIAKVDDIRFMRRGDATKVILALRDITEKAGFNPDEPARGMGNEKTRKAL
jgi:hypothetical protein